MNRFLCKSDQNIKKDDYDEPPSSQPIPVTNKSLRTLKKLTICTARAHVEKTDVQTFVLEWLKDPLLRDFYKSCLLDFSNVTSEYFDTSKGGDRLPSMLQTAAILRTIQWAKANGYQLGRSEVSELDQQLKELGLLDF